MDLKFGHPDKLFRTTDCPVSLFTSLFSSDFLHLPVIDTGNHLFMLSEVMVAPVNGDKIAKIWNWLHVKTICVCVALMICVVFLIISFTLFVSMSRVVPTLS